MIKIKRGLDLPIEGRPSPEIEAANPIQRVGLVGEDFVGMKPTMRVREGDRVALGDVLFTDKKNAGVRYTSPGSGRVAAIHRGAKRIFQSVVIELDGDDEVTFPDPMNAGPRHLSRQDVVKALIDSGLWTSIRTRPFSKVPDPEAIPRSLFVTAIDTHPLAGSPESILRGREDDFLCGLHALSPLCERPLFLCKGPEAKIPGSDLHFLQTEVFSGPHPAGLPGTHIHFLDPVNAQSSAWYVGYQDVVAIGHLFRTGRLLVDRVVSLAGPGVSRPRLLRTRMGASIEDLVKGELNSDSVRVLSGSVLSGRISSPNMDFLGRYHLQISAIREQIDREFMGWVRPGFKTFSVTRAFASALQGGRRRFDLTTTLAGSPRSLVPIGSYEKVMPLDIYPTHLLKALLVGDTVEAQALGCLELDEEDLALCSYVCPCKHEFGPILRENLNTIERDG
ncbi:MAG: Na(+)-translocating NADH-quinone reductase subunit A [Planctomycetota bacterium]|jgi:Na+-transporting NADH:ubiquinone oxidoreductase subunit A|nr:Na(+)-translocating NADH-quinone reductase subunit A [Planctomycetota bacterium]